MSVAGSGEKVQLHFYVTKEEEEQIRERMAQAGVRNLSAYLRKAAINGYIIHLDLSSIGGMVSLLRRCSNNINQLTKRANAGRSIYAEDIEALQKEYNGCGSWPTRFCGSWRRFLCRLK